MDGLNLKAVEQTDSSLIELARSLFLEYQAEHDDNPCFKTLDAELASLPGDYSLPRGGLWIAYQEDEPAGCVALRPLKETECEMKRLFVRPRFRGTGLGKFLAERCIAEARIRGYSALRLDTIHTMKAAQEIYRQLGFYETPHYYQEPIDGVRCLMVDL